MERIVGLEIDLRCGPVNPVFRTSRIPDFRHCSDEDQVSPQNLARHELYLERLRMVGVNPIDHEFRLVRGLAFKQEFRRPKFKAHEQASVQA